jgi:protein TonB
LKPVQENQVSLGGGQAGNSPVQSENDEIFRKIREKIEQAKIYPQLALRRGLSGVVRIRFQVGEDGLPKKTQILESSGSELLDNATLKTLDRAAPFPRVAGWISFPLRYDLARNPS